MLSNKKEATNQDLEKISFLNNGMLLFFEQNHQFIFVQKQTTKDMKAKVLALQQSGVTTKFNPMEVCVAVLRKNITEDNIGQFYDKEVLRFTGDSTTFITKYFTNPIYKRHTKTKGIMNKDDILVQTWIRYQGTKENMAVFGLGIGGTDGVVTN